MEFIEIGKIINVFGIKGEVKVDNYSDFIDERYKKDSIVYLGKDKLPLICLRHHEHKGYLLLTFKDHEDINLVEPFKNMTIYKSKDDIKPLKEGHYYFSDLKDLNVYINDELIGKVLEVEEGIRNNNLRVLLQDKREVLIPYIPQFILKVDLKEKRIDVKEMVGLI